MKPDLCKDETKAEPLSRFGLGFGTNGRCPMCRNQEAALQRAHRYLSTGVTSGTAVAHRWCVPALQNILVAVDDRDAAVRAVEYVAAFVAGRGDAEIHLLHALRPLPPQLMESPGSEDPSVEQQIEQRQVAQQKSWNSRAETQVVPLLESARSQITAANIPAEKIATHILQLNDRGDLVPELIRAAREYRCHTIIVGYNDYPWIKEKFHAHIAEQLIAQSERLAVCVVK